MSFELRKVLFRWLGKHTQPLVFGTFRGTKQNQRNVLQDLKDLGKELGISGVRFSFHTLRHTFATHYLRKGGNLFYLSRVLGHASISTAQIYLRSLGVDFRAVHDGLSMLTR
jgi:integrase/recombinase XerD